MEVDSIALQRYLETEIRRGNIPDPILPADFLDMLHAAKVQADDDYLSRIAQVAYERYTARQIVAEDVPTMIIVPEPLNGRQAADLLGDRPNYVMVFGAESVYFQDTVHARAVDSCGEANVLGAHIGWLSSDGAGVERAIVLDRDGFVKEMAFEEPVSVHVVQILHLPLKNERQLHRELSAYFRDRDIPQINPYESGSERADDKAWTHALWEQHGREIVSPKYTLIPQSSSSEEIAECLRTFVKDGGLSEVVVQPNKGTEGYNVEKFSVATGLKLALQYVRDRVLPEDDAIVRERRGNVSYRQIPPNPPLQRGGSGVSILLQKGGTAVSASASSLRKGDFRFLNVTFRVNVAWNGSEFIAESGYAQVAKDEETFPASRGRGGAIVDINEALANLYYHKREESYPPLQKGVRGDLDGRIRWIRLIPTDEDIAAMKTAAINAARALNAGLDVENYLKHIGIDILLEVKKSGAVIPVALETNPRPAGLSHSSEIVGVSHRKPS